MVTGPATVVEAIGAGKRVAEEIDFYLKGEEMKLYEETPLVVDRKAVWRRFEDVEEGERQAPKLVSASERVKNFQEIKTGYTAEEARREAGRCLACGCAIGCGICQRICIYSAFDQVGDGYQVDAEKCDGCGFCVDICSNECISMVKISPGD